MSDVRKELRDTICKLGTFAARTRTKAATEAEREKRAVDAHEDAGPKVEAAEQGEQSK